jgi:hypothetical protein
MEFTAQGAAMFLPSSDLVIEDSLDQEEAGIGVQQGATSGYQRRFTVPYGKGARVGIAAPLTLPPRATVLQYEVAGNHTKGMPAEHPVSAASILDWLASTDQEAKRPMLMARVFWYESRRRAKPQPPDERHAGFHPHAPQPMIG